MDNLIALTQYVFGLLDKMIDVINDSILLQFGVLLVFAYFAVSCLKKIISDNDDNSKGGVSL